MSDLIIIRGIPGSGKSTMAQKLLNSNEVDVHIEADMYHVVDGVYEWNAKNVHDAHIWCQNHTYMELANNKRVVVSNTFTTIKELKPYFEIAEKFNIVPKVIHCKGNFGNIHDVPEATLIKMKERFQEDISSLYRDPTYV